MLTFLNDFLVFSSLSRYLYLIFLYILEMLKKYPSVSSRESAAKTKTAIRFAPSIGFAEKGLNPAQFFD
jgi:hypothetical protein